MRLLGIDVGKTVIRAVEIESALGRFEVMDHYEYPIPPHYTNRYLAVTEFVKSLPRLPEKISVCLSSEQVIFRNLVIQSKNKKAIQAAVVYELEDEVPFDLEDSLYDYTVTSQGIEGSRVHMASTTKALIKDILDSFGQAGIDPDLITSESWAYQTFFKYSLPKDQANDSVLIVHFGSQTTSFFGTANGVPILSKTLYWGGDNLTKAISAKYNISSEEAEKVKVQNGFLVPSSQRSSSTRDQIDLSDTLTEPLREFLLNFKQVNLIFKKYTQSYPKITFINGGMALLPGLSQVIFEETGFQVEVLDGLSRLSSRRINYSKLTDVSFSLAAGLALCLMSTEKSRVINFRSGEFALSKEPSFLSWTALKRPLSYTALITFVFVISGLVQNTLYQSRLEDVNDQLEKSIRSFFGGISKSVAKNYVNDPNRLRKAVEKNLREKRELAELSTPNPKSPLVFLKNISKKIPKQYIVDVTDFQVGTAASKPFQPKGSTNLNMTMVMLSKESTDTMEKLLKPIVKTLEKSDVREIPSPYNDGKRVSVRFSGEPQESEYEIF